MHISRPLLVLLSLAPLAAQESGQKKVDFAKQILPILEARCIECHGAEDAEAELRLDIRAGLYPKERKWWTVEPGKPDKSLFFERITLPADDDDIMPAEGDPLNKQQIALIKQWILEGAEWPEGVKAGGAAAPKEEPLALPGMDASSLKAQEAAMAAIQQMGGLAMAVAQGSKATEVNLGLLGKKVEDAHLQKLAPMAKSLIRLDLARTGVGDGGMAHIRKLQQLRWLNLSGTAVTDAGVKQLAGMQHLAYLNLYGSKVSDAAVDTLAGLPALKKVFLWQTKVSAQGAARLRKARPGLMVDRGESAEALSKVVIGPVPINKKCPVSGKPVAANKKVIHEGQAVGMCCDKCVKAFKKAPAKYLGKVAEFVPTTASAPENKNCPLNAKKKASPKQTVAYKGVRVGFCCAKCKGRFTANPTAFEKSLEPLIAKASKAHKAAAKQAKKK